MKLILAKSILETLVLTGKFPEYIDKLNSYIYEERTYLKETEDFINLVIISQETKFKNIDKFVKYVKDRRGWPLKEKKKREVINSNFHRLCINCQRPIA